MPKNSKGGSRFKKGVRNSGAAQMEEKLVLRESKNSEYYAYVLGALGNCRFNVLLVNNSSDDSVPPTLGSRTHLAILPGRMKKQKWKNFVAAKDFVLVSKRDFQMEDNPRVDILHKYTAEAVRKMCKLNQLPSSTEAGDHDEPEATSVTFDYGNEEEEDAFAGGGASSAAPAPAPSTAAPAPAVVVPSTQTWEETFDGI